MYSKFNLCITYNVIILLWVCWEITLNVFLGITLHFTTSMFQGHLNGHKIFMVFIAVLNV